MKIGIDIDDTITDSWKDYIPIYSELFNIPKEKLQKSKPYYYSLNNKISVEEYFQKMTEIHDEITPNITLKENVKEVIDKLYELGHKVIFITARGKSHSDPYKITKEYLDKHRIKYEKLIVGVTDKGKVCEEEKIELFIDDSIKHCESVSSRGIEVLLFETEYNKDNQKFKHVTSWESIYKYIISG